MTIQEIAAIVNEHGNDGSSEGVRCLDLPNGIGTRTKTYVQVVNFNDKRPLAMCWLDNDNWDFLDPYEKASEKVRNKVEEYLASLVKKG